MDSLYIPSAAVRPRDEVVQKIPVVRDIVRLKRHLHKEKETKIKEEVGDLTQRDDEKILKIHSPSSPSNNSHHSEFIHHDIKDVPIPEFSTLPGKRGPIAYYYRRQMLPEEEENSSPSDQDGDRTAPADEGSDGQQKEATQANSSASTSQPRFKKRTLICCHGIGGDAFFFYPMLYDLPPEYCSVILFDLYGRGRSGDGEYLHTADIFVRQMRDIVEHLSLQDERLILCGHSMGGAVVMDYWKIYRDQVDKVILLNPAGAAGTVPRAVSLLNIPRLGEMIVKAHTNVSLDVHLFKDLDFYGKHNKDFYDRIFKTWSREDFKRFSKTLKNSLLHMDMNTGEEALRQMTDEKVPLLLVWGQFDVTIPSKRSFSQYERIISKNPHSQIYVFRNCRHGAFIERHHDYMVLLKNFLREGSRLPADVFEKYNPPKRHIRRVDRHTKKMFEKKFSRYMV